MSVSTSPSTLVHEGPHKNPRAHLKAAGEPQPRPKLAPSLAREPDTVPAADTDAPRHRLRRLGPGKRIPFTRGIGPVLLLALWSLGSATGRVDPRILPAPWTVVSTAVQLWQAGTLGPDLAI